MQNVRFAGVPISINGSSYLLPALSLRQYADNKRAIEKMSEESGITNPRTFFAANMPLVVMAFQRNYPEITGSDLAEWVDLANFREMLLTALGRSGKPLVPADEFRLAHSPGHTGDDE